ncbi:hypothetical protein CSKR_110871 [Clonorchis sinensis]|uniref:Uncharacterized protein n=1 Tax=Clonorchis sinensis TaxID=79923 RepID=A0A8T1MRM5_CLOSI|nr:hypothetical protein CSKR_110871 [Clonorchis sinensis]
MSAAMLGKNVPTSFGAGYRGRRHYVQSHPKTSLFGSENERENGGSKYRKGRNDSSSRLASDTRSQVSDDSVSVKDGEIQGFVDSPVKNGLPPKEHVESNGGIFNTDRSKKVTSSAEPCKVPSEDYAREGRNSSLPTPNESMKTFHSNRVIQTTDFEQNTQRPEAESIEQNGVDGLIKAAKERAERRELERQVRSTDNEDILSHDRKTPDSHIQKRAALQAPWYTDPNEGIGNTQFRRPTMTKRSTSSPRPNFQRSTSEMDYQTYSAQQLRELRMPTCKYGNKESVPWYPEYTASRFSKRDGETYKTSTSKIGESFLRVFGVDSQSSKDCEASEQQAERTTNGKLSSLRSTPYAQHY